MDEYYGSVEYENLATEADVLLASFLTRLHYVLSIGTFSDSDIVYMNDCLSQLYYVLLSRLYRVSFSLSYLHRLMYFILTIPIDLKAEKSFVSLVYRKISIIDNATFYISQLTSEEFNDDVIGDFIDFINGSELYVRDCMFLSRINKPAVLDKMSLDVKDVSLLELYYGISTGYFSFCEWASASYDRLIELMGNVGVVTQKEFDTIISEDDFLSGCNPLAILRRLKSDGFISNISRFITLS